MFFEIENWNIEAETGYKPITTFYTDFSIAEKFGGIEAIKDTYNRAFKEWKHDYKYITELAMALNWKSFRWYEVKDEFCELYTELFKRLDAWIMDNLKGEELDYYIRTTD